MAQPCWGVRSCPGDALSPSQGVTSPHSPRDKLSFAKPSIPTHAWIPFPLQNLIPDPLSCLSLLLCLPQRGAWCWLGKIQGYPSPSANPGLSITVRKSRAIHHWGFHNNSLHVFLGTVLLLHSLRSGSTMCPRAAAGPWCLRAAFQIPPAALTPPNNPLFKGIKSEMCV